MKGQIATEHLAMLGTFLAVAIPLTLLFITMLSFNKDELRYYNTDVVMALVSRAVERSLAQCSEDNLTTLLSLRLPDNVEGIEVIEENIGGKEMFYVKATLKDGSTLLKPIKISEGVGESGWKIEAKAGAIDRRIERVAISCWLEGDKAVIYVGRA